MAIPVNIDDFRNLTKIRNRIATRNCCCCESISMIKVLSLTNLSKHLIIQDKYFNRKILAFNGFKFLNIHKWMVQKKLHTYHHNG